MGEAFGDGLTPMGQDEEKTALASQIQSAFQHEIENMKKSIGGLDNLWLMADRLTEIDSVVLTTFTLKGKVSAEEIREALKATAQAFPRFRQKLVEKNKLLHAPHFVDDPSFDLVQQIRAVELPPECDAKGFDAFHWNFDAPLWEAAVCSNYKALDGDTAIVIRSHHSLADGQGFVRAALWATTFRPQIEKLIQGPPPEQKAAQPKYDKPSDFSGSLAKLDSYTETSAEPLVKALLLLFGALEWLKDQAKISLWTIFDAFAFISLALLTWWRMVHLTPSNLEERLNFSKPSSERPARDRTFDDAPRQRDFARSGIMAMDNVKRIQKYFSGKNDPKGERLTTRVAGSHVTLNDVMVSILSEVLHRQKTKRRAQLNPGRFANFLDRILPDRIVLFIPISYRRHSDPTVKNLSLGGLVYLPRPRALDTPSRSSLDIYHTIHRAKFQLSIIKRSRTPRRLAIGIVEPLAKIPILFPWPLAALPRLDFLRRLITTPVLNTILSSAHAVVTNVPGPAKEPVELAEHEIRHWTITPPQGAQGVVSIGILSYANGLCISALTDADPSVEPSQRNGGLARIICDDFDKTAAQYLAAAQDDEDHQLKFD